MTIYVSRLSPLHTKSLIRWAKILGISTDQLCLRIVAAALEGDRYVEKQPDCDTLNRQLVRAQMR